MCGASIAASYISVGADCQNAEVCDDVESFILVQPSYTSVLKTIFF